MSGYIGIQGGTRKVTVKLTPSNIDTYFTASTISSPWSFSSDGTLSCYTTTRTYYDAYFSNPKINITHIYFEYSLSYSGSGSVGQLAASIIEEEGSYDLLDLSSAESGTIDEDISDGTINRIRFRLRKMATPSSYYVSGTISNIEITYEEEITGGPTARKIKSLYIGVAGSENETSVTQSNISSVFSTVSLGSFRWGDENTFYASVTGASSSAGGSVSGSNVGRITNISGHYNGNKGYDGSCHATVVFADGTTEEAGLGTGNYDFSIDTPPSTSFSSFDFGITGSHSQQGTAVSVGLSISNLVVTYSTEGSVAKKVKTAYIGINGVAKRWFNGSIDPTDPNTRYETKNLGVWDSLSDVDAFFSKYNHDNNYTGLSLGNVVTIGTYTRSYSETWIIAGFDMEHNQTAADGTVYDNGYGICLIPGGEFFSSQWNSSSGAINGYKSSTVHQSLNSTLSTMRSDILGTHLINRNVLLSSHMDTNGSSAYTWTTAYGALLTIGQYTGDFVSIYNNIYDIGEATYKLPLFDYDESYLLPQAFWTRYISGDWGSTSSNTYAYAIEEYDFDPRVYSYRVTNTNWVRPLIYLR